MKKRIGRAALLPPSKREELWRCFEELHSLKLDVAINDFDFHLRVTKRQRAIRRILELLEQWGAEES